MQNSCIASLSLSLSLSLADSPPIVRCRYCDGGSFSGNRETEFHNANGTSVWFRGHAIVQAIQDSLIADNGLASATDVVVSGCSAGGLATYLQCDNWAERVAEVAPQAKVRCMPDSGKLLPLVLLVIRF
eukprot:COSAG02_NODE_3870_length_6117_cov_7.546195_3_plen_129_part_00